MSNETATAYPGVAALVHKHLGKVPFTASKHSTDVVLHVAPDHFLELVRGLKERRELAFDFLRNVTAIDMTEEGLRAVYHFYSFKHHHSLQVDVNTPPGNPHIPSLTALYSAANWHEREAAEMVGLVFDGHPNPKNLLLDEDVRIHPLLKAHPLQKGEFFQGIEDTSAGFKF
ncbi:MAG: NADH-quinone oxidoreductase subunit C [Dehalococcoidia bacterium]|jgi:NADH-quinone oxidoreductase subunit C|uniref:NADH-quinone oxidoreductase subunit C n=1 Tax=Candidatus Amarobacter glycogenicus TaxID=3140699 RepID=UPI002A0F5B3E|nr:NADH-quinone oxidoreductase subunit C [Dehalococcoidia bacterium]MBK7126446.1 NADH-quinone oxidoreductase subunit C [Dehalococcoidia bacterium]MBK8560939.1 NADH-quinone oxidoreductase subunit C [Dehalococcoidia bacterium]MBK9609971.1 NADH-quinone oxidoreductase subunit C [Dehalococcoidia bacterium]MCC6269518.1 NADH-quinone oxidoreductase subunit C [Dehalococcoidia bacterium]